MPPPGRIKVLTDLHSGHPGMKALSRSLVMWPGLDSDIEKMVKPCQQSQPLPAAAPLHLWQWPWSKVHIDYTGPLDRKIVMDAHSK